MKKFIEKNPPVVSAFKFKEPKSEADFKKLDELGIIRTPVTGGWVVEGSGGIIYDISPGDYICECSDPLFPFGQDSRDFVAGRKWAMKPEQFEAVFVKKGGKKDAE